MSFNCDNGIVIVRSVNYFFYCIFLFSVYEWSTCKINIKTHLTRFLKYTRKNMLVLNLILLIIKILKNKHFAISIRFMSILAGNLVENINDYTLFIQVSYLHKFNVCDNVI